MQATNGKKRKADELDNGIKLIPLETKLNCPVCLEILVEPMLEKCGHTICRLCRNAMQVSKKEKKIKCPLCTTLGTFTNKNFTLETVLQTLPEYHKRMQHISWHFSYDNIKIRLKQLYGRTCEIKVSNTQLFEGDKEDLLMWDVLKFILTQFRNYDEMSNHLLEVKLENLKKWSYIIMKPPWMLFIPTSTKSLFIKGSDHWTFRMWM